MKDSKEISATKRRTSSVWDIVEMLGKYLWLDIVYRSKTRFEIHPPGTGEKLQGYEKRKE